MKNFIRLLCISLLLIGIKAQAQITEQINFSISDVGINQSNTYDAVNLKDGTILYGEGYVGQPQLPVAHINILMPKGATVANVSINGSQQIQLQGSFNLYPVQMPYAPNFSDPPPFVGPDTAIYNSNNPFSGKSFTELFYSYLPEILIYRNQFYSFFIFATKRRALFAKQHKP